MKNKKYMFLCFGLLLAFLLAYLVGAIWKPEWRFHLNLTKYHETTVGPYGLSFHGSFGKVRRVKLLRDGESLAKEDFFTEADFLSDPAFDPVLLSLTGETDAIFLQNGVDEDGDVHVSLYTVNGAGEVTAYGYALANPRYEDGLLVSEERYREDTAESEIHVPPYKDVTVRTEYRVRDGIVTPAEEEAVIYYSETGIYCVSTRAWDEESGQWGYSREKWLQPEKYETEKPKIALRFSLPLPE